ncbi:fatty acid synthase-like [Daktulosphaira vitifoliae]|uniref:fatty acid synthase-like n=1 Tax=Daktulosphaira vitifoliae TaxID=58002 RepID=UPI0021AAC1E5|nr:fatty acid synthase-like [Daktulosphaira vitifoliae]XP_050542992.1 fatty acid synthase-like [Daktulosphaira vitifoliae]
MAPNSQSTSGNLKYIDNDDIVISGISGRFPNCDSFEEFKQKLFNGTDILAEGESRWPEGIHGTVTKIGVIKNLSKFDSTFFGVHPKLADRMDPQVRILLESTYEAFIDAGMNPTSMRGSNTGVVIATTENDSADWWSAEPDRVNGYEFLGVTRTMFPNRISYSFDLKGPSYSIDTGSSGSLLAFEHAYRMIRTGVADGVIIGGCSLILNPVLSVMLQKFNSLAPDGVSKPFDASGQGYVRSDAIVVLYLQRARDAKRVYATALNACANTEGFRLEGAIHPSNVAQMKLYKEVLDNAHVSPADVDYVESNACGDQLKDSQELNAVTEVYCKNRSKPLLIGSVKSNMGDSEPASGLCGIVKLVLAMENQEIPPTLHYVTPNPKVPALKDGRLQVVSKSLPWKGGIAAVNSIGIGGSNAHVLLKSSCKDKKPHSQDPIPRLIIGSGRTESSVNYMLNRVEETPRDPELYGLLYNVQSENIPGHLFRGYSILGEHNNREVVSTGVGKREVWFVFAGMGSQWIGMGRELMELAPFQKSVEKSAIVLKSLGLDLYALYNSNDPAIFDNPLNTFVGIASIQMALIDILKLIEIEPDKIIGHSAGELACAYADGTLTVEQAITIAYWRGRSILDKKLPPGAMASIGLSWEEVKTKVPSDVFVACNNTADNVTISGPPDSISKFVNKLKSEGVFAREINSCGVAFHSPYILSVGPAFKEKVKGVVPNPKPRSSRWLSTSIPESEWNSPLAQFSSISYQVNNLVSPVYFLDVLKQIPDNSIVIEIAPNSIFQPLLKSSTGSNCTHLGLLRRNQSTTSDLLRSIGKLFNAGLQPKLENLYPPIEYPVSRGTPSLQPLVEWDHSSDWHVCNFIETETATSGEIVLEIDVENNSYNYLKGTFVDGVEVLPYSSYLLFVWNVLAKLQLKSLEELPVVFDDVQFFKLTSIPSNGKLTFIINILKETRQFEIKENDCVVVSGFIDIQVTDDQIELTEIKDYDAGQLMSNDIYKDLTYKGYKYGKTFQNLSIVSQNGNSGSIDFDGQWAPFLESLLQVHLLNLDTRHYHAIKYINKISILPKKHYQSLSSKSISFNVYENIRVVKTAGVEFTDIRSQLVPVRKEIQKSFDLDTYSFIPYESNEVDEPLNLIAQIVLDNVIGHIEVCEIVTIQQELLILQVLNLISSKTSTLVNCNVYAKNISHYKTDKLVAYHEHDITSSTIENPTNLVLTHGVIENKNLFSNIIAAVKNGGFLLTVEHSFDPKFKQTGIEIVAKYTKGHNMFILLKKVTESSNPLVIATGSSFSWVEFLKSNLKNTVLNNKSILLVGQNLDNSGVIPLTKSLRQDSNGHCVRCISVKDNKAPAFSLTAPLYQEQLKKDLAINVFKNGVWGTYALIPYKQTMVQAEHAFIGTTKVGDLSSLQYIEGKLSKYNVKEYPNYNLCYPYYVPLNGLDVKFANGGFPYNGLNGDIAQQESYLGMEFSGRDSSGKRVIGLVPGGALATSVLVHKDLVWQIPDEWTLEEASTIPRVYSLAYYALVVRGNIQSGESMYVHAGASGISTAVIAVALELGVIPYVGVFNREQKEFLKSIYPQLNDHNFANLADNGGFEQHLLEQTEGRGVDLIFDTYTVINKRQEFVNSLAEYGRLIEFEVVVPVSDSLGISGNMKSISFNKISLSTIHFSDSEIKYIQRLVAQGIKNKHVKPLSTTIFPVNKVEEAFKFTVCGSYLGRVVVKIRDEEKTNVPAKHTVTALPKSFFSSEKSLVISGDDDALSLELIQHLASRSARKFVLVTKNKVQSGFKTLVLRRLKNKGVNVVMSSADLSTVKGVEEALKEALQLGPVCGFYHLSNAPSTGLLHSLSENDFSLAKNNVADIVANFDTISRRVCPQMEHFVILAPTLATRGEVSKTNYAFAHASLHNVAEIRSISGYPIVIVEYGAISECSDSFNDSRYDIQPMASALNILDNVTRQNNHLVISCSKLLHQSLENTDAASLVLMKIAKLFGHNALSDVEPTFTLAQLGLDTILGPKVQSLIQQETNTLINIEDLRLMSFPTLHTKINSFLA